MLIEQLSLEALEVINSNDDLKRYLLSLNKPKEFTPPSWLWDGIKGNPKRDLDRVLADWKSYLSARLGNGSKFEKSILEFDLASESKWGPQGGHPPLAKALENTVLPSFKRQIIKQDLSAFTTPEWRQAKAERLAQLKSLKLSNLRPMRIENVVKHIQSQNAERLASNSGYPSFSRRKKESVWRLAVADAETGKYIGYPAILLFRYYRGKLRMVWMYPFATNLVEASYYLPLFNGMISKPELISGFFSPWSGFEGVRRLVTETYAHGAQIAASDFSATDEHFSKSVSLEVGDMLQHLFQPAYRAGFMESLEHMHDIPLLITPSEQVRGEHGVSSGSIWTNFIETIFDWILARYCEILTDEKVQGLYAIGDDMAWTVKGMQAEEFKHFLEQIGTSVGQEIKAEKTMLKPDSVKTLQRLFQAGYMQDDGDELRGVYPTIRALNSLVYPERFHSPQDWSYDMFATRVFMILENCVDHPLFREFVDYVCSGSPRLYAWASQKDSKLDSIHKTASNLTGLVPTYNQEKKASKLSSFKSVQMARELNTFS